MAVVVVTEMAVVVDRLEKYTCGYMRAAHTHMHKLSAHSFRAHAHARTHARVPRQTQATVQKVKS